MKKLVIFDLDGTLLDTIEDLGNATNHALRTLGFPERRRDEFYKLVGRGITNLFKGAVPAGCDTPETIDRMRELFLAHYGVHLCDLTHPYPGIPELLAHITARGVQIAVASNKYQEGAETVIGHFFGKFPWTTVLGQSSAISSGSSPG